MYSDTYQRCGVYSITNTVTGRVYIGSSIDLHTRWTRHKYFLRRGTHHCSKLQRSWIKHGEETFVSSPVLFCNKENLCFYEQIIIDAYDAKTNGYNVCPTAGSALGRIVSSETRAKMSASLSGKKRSPEICEALRTKQLGKSPSASARAKISAANKGKIRTADTRAKMSAAMLGNQHMLGKRHSKETIEKMKVSQRGSAPSRDAIEKARITNTGRNLSVETRNKMSASRLGNKYRLGTHQSPDARAKISIAKKEWHARRRMQQSENAGQ